MFNVAKILPSDGLFGNPVAPALPALPAFINVSSTSRTLDFPPIFGIIGCCVKIKPKVNHVSGNRIQLR